MPSELSRAYKSANDRIADWEEKADIINKKLNPLEPSNEKFPFYVTGARALLRIGGRERAIAKKVAWKISFTATPINTIDTPFPWDIDVGQVKINASVTEFMAPSAGPEAGHLFNIMKSAVHQPMVEMQVLDSLGSALFYSKGMFVEVNGDVAFGRMANWNAKFIGTAYQHFVSQNFRPYDSLAGKAESLIDGLQNLTSTATGGIL